MNAGSWKRTGALGRGWSVKDTDWPVDVIRRLSRWPSLPGKFETAINDPCRSHSPGTPRPTMSVPS
ncbi:MAG TPA: hypothetical protein VKG43_12575, partial [Acidimicrobiales bacterium]|nr:hypothetical protein [Acidimicrobiales bacterium]